VLERIAHRFVEHKQLLFLFLYSCRLMDSSSMNMWASGLGAAVVLKLASSIDDVLWLTPFFTSDASLRRRSHHAAIYISVCLMQTVVAMSIAVSGESLVAALTQSSEKAWSTDKILSVFAGSMLALYTLKLLCDYIAELRDETEAADNEASDVESNFTPSSKGSMGQSPLMTESSQKNVGRTESILAEGRRRISELKMDTAKEKPTRRTLFVVSFVGSIDDLTLFVPMLCGKSFGWVQLVLGSLIAASSIVMLCCFLTACKPLSRIISSIPFPLIVGAFATVLLYRGLTMN